MYGWKSVENQKVEEEDELSRDPWPACVTYFFCLFWNETPLWVCIDSTLLASEQTLSSKNSTVTPCPFGSR